MFPSLPIISIEYDARSPDVPTAAARLAGFSNLDLRFGDATRLLPGLVQPGDIVLIDGPKGFRGLRLALSLLASGKPALMTVLKNHDQWDKSNVLFRDGIITEYNKRTPGPEMAHIDFGLGILSASVLENEPAHEPFDLADIYYRLSVRGLLAGHEVFGRFYEIGSQQGLNDTIAYFNREDRE